MRRVARSVRSVAGLLAVVLAEFGVLVAVVALELEPAAVIVLYLVALTTAIALSVLKILFAQEPPPAIATRLPFSELGAKRGSWQPHERIPPVYPRNVPFAFAVLQLWAIGVVCYLGVLVWGFEVDLWSAVSPPVVLGAIAFVGARSVKFWAEYVGTDTHTATAPDAVQPGRQLLFLLALAYVGGLASPDGGATSALVVLILLSIVTDVLGYVLSGLRTRLGVRDWLDDRFGWLRDQLPSQDHDPVTPPATVLPEAEPTARVRVDQRAILVGVVLVALLLTALNRLSIVVACLLFLLALAGAGPGLLGLAVVPIVLLFMTNAASQYLLTGTLEYQRRGEYVVGYDRLLEEPQWATTVSGSEVELDNRVIDRLLGTRTLTLSAVDAPGDINAHRTMGAPSVRLGPVSDLEETIDTLGLPLYERDLPESNHTMLAVGLALAAFFFVIPLAMLASPEVSTGMTIAVMVLVAPMFLLPVGALIWASLSRI